MIQIGYLLVPSRRGKRSGASRHAPQPIQIDNKTQILTMVLATITESSQS